MVNKSLRTLLRCLVSENLKAWDIVLFTAGLAYNNSVNRTTGLSQFEIGYKLRAPIDLISMFASQHPSESASTFASHLHALH